MRHFDGSRALTLGTFALPSVVLALKVLHPHAALGQRVD